MRRSRFTEEQVIAILAEQERGTKTAEVCRKHGISQGPSRASWGDAGKSEPDPIETWKLPA